MGEAIQALIKYVGAHENPLHIGLVPKNKTITVHRNGKTFTQERQYWVKPEVQEPAKRLKSSFKSLPLKTKQLLQGIDGSIIETGKAFSLGSQGNKFTGEKSWKIGKQFPSAEKLVEYYSTDRGHRELEREVGKKFPRFS